MAFRNRNGTYTGTYQDDENPYWISFSDIMAALLVIFILASLALMIELMETQDKVDVSIENIFKAEEVRRQILGEIKAELAVRNIIVEITDNESVVRIPEELLTFESDQYGIPKDLEARDIVYEIGAVIHSTIAKGERWRYLDTVFVEGHTDIRRSHRHMGNWGLSAYRAISVWNFWNENLPEGQRMDALPNHNNEKLFSVSGYGATRPWTEMQATEDDYRKNRRIDIRFTVKKPTMEDFQAIRAGAGVVK